MADIQIRSAFVDKVLIGKDGPFGVKTSEPHSRKNDHGGYDTTGRTFRTIRGKDIDWTQFNEGDRIAAFGREVTEEREYEGKKYYDLIVWAEAVMVIPRAQGGSGRGSAPSTSPGAGQGGFAPQADAWATPGDNTDRPF